MANIVITAVGGKNYHKVDFGVYSEAFGISHLFFWADDIKQVHLEESSGISVIVNDNKGEWILSYDGTADKPIVDTVLGVAPSSDSDLADKIANLKG